MLPLGCTSYWWWCALTRVSNVHQLTCVPSTRSSVLKENYLYGLQKKDLMLRAKMCGRGGTTATWGRSTQARQDSSVLATQTRLSRKHRKSATSINWGTKRLCRQTTTNAQQPVLNASLPLIQADLPRIIEAVSTYLSTQPQQLPTTMPEDDISGNQSEHCLGK